MPQSLSLVIGHVIFSTKDRFPCLGPSLRPQLHAYLSSVGRNAGCDYIDGQEEHHRTQTFQEEFRALLAKYTMGYDEAYLWD